MARILWLPPSLLQSSTRSCTPTCAGHRVPTGVPGAPATTQGPFAPEALPPILYGPMHESCGSMPPDLSLVSSRLMPSTAGTSDCPSFDYVASSESVVPPATGARLVHVAISSQATAAFASKRWLGAHQVLPQTTSHGYLFSTLQAFSSITTLSFTRPPLSLPRSCTRRGLGRWSLLGIRFLLPSRASYPVESTNCRARICTC
jgi:hypothetical protein